MSSFTQLPVRARDGWVAVGSSYPALSGGFYGFNMTFSDFGPSTRCPLADSSSLAIANNPATQAGHPHYFSGTSFVRNARSADFLFTPGNTDAARHSAIFDADGALGGGLLVPSAEIGEGVEMPASRSCLTVSRLGIRRCPVSPTPTHRMLVFESMDADTESRRIAPLTLSSQSSVDVLVGATVVDTNATGAAHSRHLSSFFPIVAVDQPYNASFGGGSPFHCRLHMLHATSKDAVLLQLNYSGVSERLDVYRSGSHVASSGSVTIGGLSERVHGPLYIPTLEGSDPGANYFDDTTEQLYVLVKTAEPIEILMAPVLKVALELILEGTLSKFAFVRDFAAALAVDASDVVIVRVTTGSSRRRRQQAGSQAVTVEAEVGEQPSATRVAGAAVLGEAIQTAQSSLTSAAATLVSLVQAGALADALSSTGVGAVHGLQLVLPVGLDRTAPPAIAGGYVVQIPNSLGVQAQPDDKLELNENFTVAGIVRDSLGRACTVLGLDQPWNLTASIKPGTGGEGATLSGKSTVVEDFKDGIASFRRLSISVTGAGYVIALRASNGYYAETPPFDVGPIPVPFNPWQIVITLILFVIIGLLFTCVYVLRRRRMLKRIVPTDSLLDGIEQISTRVPTPDLHYLPRPDAFVGVPIQDLFTRDLTTATTMQPTASEPAMLEVEVVRARNLKRMDLNGFGLSDPFCVVEQARTSHYTEIIDDDLNPVWNETFSFWVQDERKDLIITMFDKDSSGADLMGEVRFKLSDLTPHAVWKTWHPLRKSKEMKKKDTVKGDIQLAVRTWIPPTRTLSPQR